MRPAERNTEAAASTAWAETVLAAVLSLVPLFWRIALDAGRFPVGDAWAYEKIFATFDETGRIVFVGWNDITLVGMLPLTKAWVIVVGSGPHQLHLLGSVMGFVSLLGLRSLLVYVGVRRRLLPILVLGTFTGFVSATGTYQSDLFCFAGVSWSLALVARLVTIEAGWRAHALTIGSAVCAFAAFSVRQHTVIVAVAVGIALWSRRASHRDAWWMFTVVFTTLAVPLYVWRKTIDHGGEEVIRLDPGAAAANVFSMGLTLGVLALPFVVSSRATRPMSTIHWIIIAAAPVLLIAGAMIRGTDLFVGENPTGALMSYGGPVGWTVAVGVALAAGWVGQQLLRIALPSSRAARLLREILVVVVVLDSVAAAFNRTFFPRYALASGALLVCLLALAMTATPRDIQRRCTVAAGIIALASLWELDRSASPVRAVREAGDIAACAGIAGDELDGGFVWDGVHSEGVVNANRDRAVPDDGLPATDEQRVFVNMDRQAVLVNTEPEPATGLVAVGPFESSGLLPGNHARRWIVAFDTHGRALDRCEND